MGNQLSLDDNELYYFAGLLDGEGSVMLVRTGSRGKHGERPLVPQVRLTNTDPTIIQFVVNILIKLGVQPWIETREQKKNWNTAYSVLVSGIKKTNKVLEVMCKFLLAKKAQAELVLEFNRIRMATGRNQKNGSGYKYGSQEQSIFERMKLLNHRGLTETGDGKHQLVTNWFDVQDSPSCDESRRLTIN